MGREQEAQDLEPDLDAEGSKHVGVPRRLDVAALLGYAPFEEFRAGVACWPKRAF
jgi:hypothetical protein